MKHPRKVIKFVLYVSFTFYLKFLIFHFNFLIYTISPESATTQILSIIYTLGKVR